MATYEELYGKRVKEFDSDPTLESSYEGQVWYDKATGVLKSVVTIEGWSSSGPLSLARNDLAGAGTQTAGLAFGGQQPPTVYATTEEYNGVGWSNGGDLGTATKGGGGAGTQTAGLAFGGNYPVTDATQEYDGSSWTAGGGMGTGRYALGGVGTQTAGLAFGGRAQTANTNATEEYNGSSWTAGGNMARTGDTLIRLAGAGLQTAALGFGGLTTNLTEEYDGSSWTSGGAMNTARWSLGGCGIQTSALAFGGSTTPDSAQTKTEKYDGTSWTETSDLSTGRWEIGGGVGTQSASLAHGGYNGTASVALTEEFTQSINTITAAAWASGGTYPYAAANLVSLGPATGMLSCGGNNSGPTKQTTVTLYNGTSYSSETAMPVAANGMGQGKGGTETAGLIFGGSTPGGNTTATILYNGSSWTSGGALSTARRNLGGLGISTAALAFGGQEPSYSTATEEYGGSSWTAGGALPAARRNATGVGSQTAGLVLAGQSPPGAGVNTSFTYNGTSYSGGPTMINSRSDGAASGPNSSNTSALVYGGTTGSPNYTVILTAETYDGSSFSTAPNLSTGRDGQGSGASATEGVQVAGYVPSDSYLSATEQFTPESTAVTASTLTSS